MTGRIRNPRRGMTAIELLVAATLSTILLVSVFAVLGSLKRMSNSLFEQTTDRGWEPMVAALQRDFANSRLMQMGPTRLEFDGYGGNEAAPFAATNIRGQIVYEIQTADGRPWLVRTENHPDSASVTNERQLVCAGISFFELLFFETRSRSWIPFVDGQADQKPVNSPGQLRLRAFSIDDSGLPKLQVDEMLVRHGVAE
ncbi:MAG: prepilin-type N-terminal cleavage/methylation domain-containing protein [Pirellulaceae bacterium]